MYNNLWKKCIYLYSFVNNFLILFLRLQAKLCLLLLSLPAYELFTIAVQKALKVSLRTLQSTCNTWKKYLKCLAPPIPPKHIMRHILIYNVHVHLIFEVIFVSLYVTVCAGGDFPRRGLFTRGMVSAQENTLSHPGCS